jgi:hypothetical protein
MARPRGDSLHTLDSPMDGIPEESPDGSEEEASKLPSPSEFDVHAAFMRHQRSEQVRTRLRRG